MEGLQLITTAGWSATGRITTENGPVPATLARNRVNLLAALVSPDLEPRTSGLNTNSQIRDDWTFAVTNIFGASRIQVMTPTGWTAKAVMHGDRDITDEPLDMKSGEELTGIEVVLTDRVTRVSGQINNEKGGIAEGTEHASCFWPRHALQATTDNGVVEYVVCFHCNLMEITRDGKSWYCSISRNLRSLRVAALIGRKVSEL